MRILLIFVLMKRKKQKFSSRKSLRYRGTECLNCGQPLDRSDAYCPRCSQLNSTKSLTAIDFFSEFLSSILVYDSRLRSTLKDLLFKPGVISKNFIKGQRLKYANPFRFFLSVSIIFLLMNGILNLVTSSDSTMSLNLNLPPSESRQSKFLELFSEGASYVNKKDSITAQSLGIPLYFSERVLDSMTFSEGYNNRSSLYLFYQFHHKEESPNVALKNLGHDDTSANQWLYARAIAWNKIMYDPNGFINYVVSKFPFFLFFFTPFYAIFFWLFYSRKKYTYMEHMIFIFHIFSFIFLAMLIFLIPDYFMESLFTKLLFAIIGPLYFYLALKKFYGQSKLVTFIKFVFLSFIFIIGFFLATLFFVAASAAIY